MVERENERSLGSVWSEVKIYVFGGIVCVIAIIALLWLDSSIQRSTLQKIKKNAKQEYKQAEKEDRLLLDSIGDLHKDLAKIRKGYSILSKRNEELTIQLDTILIYYENKSDQLSGVSNDSLLVLWADRIRLIKQRRAK